MNMATPWTYQHSIETGARPEDIFALYADVPNWPRWDLGVSRVTIDGPFAAGSTGSLTPEGQDPVEYTMVAVTPNRSFSDETVLGDTRIRFGHVLEPLPGGRTRIRHSVSISGSGAEELGAMITSDVPDAMHALALLAERSAGPSGG